MNPATNARSTETTQLRPLIHVAFDLCFLGCIGIEKCYSGNQFTKISDSQYQGCSSIAVAFEFELLHLCKETRRSTKKINQEELSTLSKVPAVTLGFWTIKILATTLGETGGDAVSMSMNLGYLVGTIIFMGFFVAAVAAQIHARKFHPFLYWATIIASTTVGTTLADFADRSLGIGYLGGSTLLTFLLVSTLVAWHRTLGSIDVGSVHTPKAEAFYWLAIMFSQTLGTALGDWTADSAGLGYVGAAYIFSGMLMLVVLAYYFTKTSRTTLFWAAFILTRPLGAVVGDFLDKPVIQGGA